MRKGGYEKITFPFFSGWWIASSGWKRIFCTQGKSVSGSIKAIALYSVGVIAKPYSLSRAGFLPGYFSCHICCGPIHRPGRVVPRFSCFLLPGVKRNKKTKSCEEMNPHFFTAPFVILPAVQSSAGSQGFHSAALRNVREDRCCTHCCPHTR